MSASKNEKRTAKDEEPTSRDEAVEVMGEEAVSQYEDAMKRGYIGSTPDDTPNEAYTLRGVVGTTDNPTQDKAIADAERRGNQ